MARLRHLSWPAHVGASVACLGLGCLGSPNRTNSLHFWLFGQRAVYDVSLGSLLKFNSVIEKWLTPYYRYCTVYCMITRKMARMQLSVRLCFFMGVKLSVQCLKSKRPQCHQPGHLTKPDILFHAGHMRCKRCTQEIYSRAPSTTRDHNFYAQTLSTW